MNLHNAMRVFLAIAEDQNLSEAARTLGLSPPSVTRLLNDLEDWIGTALFLRTTRHVSLTEAGERFLPRCRQIIEEIDAIKRDADDESRSPSGTLRVTASRFLARTLIAPVLPQFLSDFPRMSVHLEATDKGLNIVTERIDLAIRVGESPESQLIQRKIGEVPLRLTATPEFLDQHGPIEKPQDLTKVPCIVDEVPDYRADWPIGKGLRVKGPLNVSDGEIARDMTLAGLGVSFLPGFFVHEDLRSGALVEVLQGIQLPTFGVFAVFPPRPFISKSARLLSDRIEVTFAENRS